MADYDRTTPPFSTQHRTLLEIVDDILARHIRARQDARPISCCAYVPVCECVSPSSSETSTEPIAELERRPR
jgi:hypothetical protein